MTQGSHPTSPGPSPSSFSSSRAEQDAVDTVHRIMGEDVVATAGPANDAPSRTDQVSDAPFSAGAPADGGSSTTEVGKEQAGQVADTVKQVGGQVTQTVQEQAGAVTAEAGQQARALLSQAQSELSSQAGATQQRAAEGLHALADELHSMVKGSEQDGPVTDLARQAADRAHQAAGWLADRDPGALLDEVRSFGRRRPGAFLALAVGAGIVAGRLTRGVTASGSSTASTPPATSTPAQPRPAVTGPGDATAGRGELAP